MKARGGFGFVRLAGKAVDLTAGAMRRRWFAEHFRGLSSRLEEVGHQWRCTYCAVRRQLWLSWSWRRTWTWIGGGGARR
jgi:hypothetical protein